MNKINNCIKVIAFDADDTLWVNETYFREAESQFVKLLAQYETHNKIDQELFRVEIKNLSDYGYGIKGFILSMIECALTLSNGQVPQKTIQTILSIGKDMLNKPIELIDGVEEVLQFLQKKYTLIVATKGDLLDQERKLDKSNLWGSSSAIGSQGHGHICGRGRGSSSGAEGQGQAAWQGEAACLDPSGHWRPEPPAPADTSGCDAAPGDAGGRAWHPVRGARGDHAACVRAGGRQGHGRGA